MSIYTIGDLHLSFNEDKTMKIFVTNWEGYEEKIKKDWLKKVKEQDIVVLPGDFSWSTYLKDTNKDFEYINKLPGKKILLKGNHDYWWSTVTSMRKYIKENGMENIDFLYNNSYKYEDTIIVGTRGWNLQDDEESKKMINRETSRLELSIQDGLKSKENNEDIIAFMHYPPIVKQNVQNNETNEFIRILQKYEIKRCYYAHLHSTAIRDAVEGEYFGIEFKLVSADGLDFELLKIVDKKLTN